jgi:signal transduction histidine kinase
VDLTELVARAVDTLGALDPQAHLVLRTERGIVVRGDDAELYDAVANVTENALKYAPNAPVEVEVRRDGAEAVVTVRDHGPGISPDEREHVFERFYRGRQRGETEGFGLGLAIAKRAVERAGGRITLESEPDEGSRFTIRLPATRSAPLPVTA